MIGKQTYLSIHFSAFNCPLFYRPLSTNGHDYYFGEQYAKPRGDQFVVCPPLIISNKMVYMYNIFVLSVLDAIARPDRPERHNDHPGPSLNNHWGCW
jgi:hypothetical protein